MEGRTGLFDGVVPGRSVGSLGAGAVAGGTESHFASRTTVSRTCEKIWSEGNSESGSSHRTGRAYQGDESDWRSPDAGRIGRGYAEELQVRTRPRCWISISGREPRRSRKPAGARPGLAARRYGKQEGHRGQHLGRDSRSRRHGWWKIAASYDSLLLPP